MNVRHQILYTLIFLFVVSTGVNAQSFEQVSNKKEGELQVLYYENPPYCYKQDGELTGIEIDILKAFAYWMKKEKGIELDLNFIAYQDFSLFYEEVKNNSVNTIGLGSVTISKKREENIKFSAPYLNNISVLVTDGSVPTSRNEEDLYANVFSLRPLTLKGSSHQAYLEEWYNKNKLEKGFEFVSEAEYIPLKIAQNAKYFGYIDIITYWKFVKNNNHYVKIHRIANKNGEHFGFVFPSTSDWTVVINEFFESGFGFTATKEYHSILQKHLGFEIINKVEIN